LNYHPIGLSLKRHFQMFAGPRKVAGIKQRAPKTEPRQFIFRVLPNHLTLSDKGIAHGNTLSQSPS
jgi:hypothetical protein